MEEANKLIALGKKHLQEEEDVMKAVDVFQEAAAMLARQFGEKADECGEAYYWYAVSLLEQERMENRVLGNALVGICVEVEEEKSEDSLNGTEKLDENTLAELRIQVYDAMAEREGETSAQTKDEAAAEKDEENAAEKKDEDKDSTAEKDPEKAEGKQSDSAEDEPKTVKEKEENKGSDGTESKTDKKEAEKPEDESKGAEGEEEEEKMEVEEEGGEGAEGNAEGQDEEDADKDSDDDVENLQLAWEMLELAKIIYKRKNTKEDQLMLSQIHMKLGEVSIESGNCKDAKEDFNECLNLQLKHLEPDSRQLAETYYNVGLQYTNMSQHDDAAELLSRSIAIINTRLKNLQKLIDDAAGPEDLPDERQEMTNLKDLLPEIKGKEEEAIHSAKMVKVAQEMQDEESCSSAAHATQNRESTSMVNSSAADGSPPETPATDISHLVRKKRKQESPKECGGKKAKQDIDEEPHTSGTQGPSDEAPNNENQTQSNQTQSNQTQSNQTQEQSSGTQGQGSGTQSSSSTPQGESSGTQGQNSGPQSSGTQEQSSSVCNGPEHGPQEQTNGTNEQNDQQPNGPRDETHGQSSNAEGDGD